MSYEPTNWKKGDKVTSARLNKIEQGIQGNDTEVSTIKEGLNALGDNLAIVTKEHLEYSGNVVDTRGKVAPSSGSLDTSIHFNLSNGTYYSNPFTTDSGKTLLLYPRDENGSPVNIVKESGGTTSLLDLNKWFLWVIKKDGLAVSAYGYANANNFAQNVPSQTIKGTLDKEPAYWLFRGAGYTGGDPIDRGLTKDTYSDVFVEYTEPTRSYVYADSLDEYIEGKAENAVLPVKENVDALVENTGDVSALVAKSAEIRWVYSGNVVDTRDKTAPASRLDNSIKFNFGRGEYFSNPFTTDTGKTIALYPETKDNQRIYITKTDGSRTYVVDIPATLLAKIIVDGLSFSLLCYRTMAQYEADARTSGTIEGVLDSIPDHWAFGGSGYTSGEAIERGFTQDSYQTEFVPYVEPTKTYVYSKDLEQYTGAFTDDLRDELFVPSDNLLDYSQILWKADSGYYNFKRGYYIAVTPGDIVETNIVQGSMDFYDASHTMLSSANLNPGYKPITVPADAVGMRMSIGINAASEGDRVMIWKAKSIESAPYERPIYRPNIKLRPEYFDGSIYDYAIPTGLTQGVIRMARYAALRTVNESREAYRFATFNTYLGNALRGMPVLRELALDCALDFIGFQENRYAGSEILAAMYPFQFGYSTGDVLVDPEGYTGTDQPDVPAISRFEVTDVTVLRISTGTHEGWDNNFYACKITMNLPQNKHYPRRATLTVYNYHGSLKMSKRLEEIQLMLADIENCTSDFIVIMGDTNSEVNQQGHRPSWDAWEAAGFRAVHHGESPTWPQGENPQRYSSMDNIFVSEHINVLGYNIVRSMDYPIDGATPLSDHDLVYADLQFDFDAVLKDTWEEPPV